MENQINIVMPMAGLGSRFSEVGITTPKPLLPVYNPVTGKPEPMFFRALDLGIDKYEIKKVYLLINPKIHKEIHETMRYHPFQDRLEIILVEKQTEGPACTSLLVANKINNSSPLIILNCDQILDFKQSFSEKCLKASSTFVVTLDGGEESKHSFAAINIKTGNCSRVREKEKISNIALTGIHFWKEGKYFVETASQMICYGDRAPNGEFYISNTFNYLTSDTEILHCPKDLFHFVGTPKEYSEYLRKVKAPITKKENKEYYENIELT